MRGRISFLALSLFASGTVASLVAGCSSKSDSNDPAAGYHGRETRGAATPARATFEDDVITADVTINGKTGALLVDTGSPLNLIDPTTFAVPSGSSRVGSVTVGGLTLVDVPIIGYLPAGGLDDGILGGGTLCQFITTIDYRASAVTLGAIADAAGVESPGTITPFALEGGGRGLFATGDTVDFPATRIAVTARIDGVDHPFIVDSGASFAVVRSTLHTALVADGRKELPIDVTLIAGATSATAFRLRSLEISGAVVPSVAAAYPGSDQLLDGVSAEVGHTIDGVVGGTFLREFLLVVDYPGRTLRLARYSTRDHIKDAFSRVGVSLTEHPTSVHHYAVSTVFDGTDAKAQGVVVGDFMVSIDDVLFDGLDAAAADRALRGDIGSMHTVVLARSSGNVTLTLRTDDLLPLP